MTGAATEDSRAADIRPDSTWMGLAASLLELAEQDERRDGWLTAGDLRQLPPDELRLSGGNKWLTAVSALRERYTDFRVLLATSNEYPALLSKTSLAPAMLFVRGSLAGDDAIAIVGSRAASDDAIDAAHTLAAALADTGTTIVSGLARGVDTAAHLGALGASGHTTAVVGTGIDVVYPPESHELLERIAQRGAVVSQFPPGLPPSKTSFPVRNAVIAGLSRASLVVEAEELSGTRIEMDYTLEFARPVLLWAPVLGSYDWARTLASANDHVHMVCSVSEIRELARLN